MALLRQHIPAWLSISDGWNRYESINQSPGAQGGGGERGERTKLGQVHIQVGRDRETQDETAREASSHRSWNSGRQLREIDSALPRKHVRLLCDKLTRGEAQVLA